MDMKDNELEDFFTTPVAETEEVSETQTSDINADEAAIEDAADEDASVEEAKSEDVEQAKLESKMVPIAALHDERQKNRDTRDELVALRSEMAQLRASIASPKVEQSAAQQPVVGQNGVPDPFDDPNSYHQYVMQQAAQQAQQMFVAQQVQHSRARAIEKHGEGVVTEAAEWFADQVKDNPSLEARALSQPDVAEWVIAQKRRSDELKLFETDRDGFIRQEAARLGLTTTLPMEVEAIPPAAKDTGPKSLVSAKSATTSASSKQQVVDAFDALFTR